MKKFIEKLNIIIGSIVVYLSIFFLAVAIDSKLLAIVGLIIAPVTVICFKKKYQMKTSKYYAGLFGIMLIAMIVSGIIMPTDSSAKNKQEIAVENKDEVSESEEDSKPDESKEVLNSNEPKEEPTDTKENIFEGYKLIQVDGGNLSGHREPNVVVDIGYGDREYWAFTNEHGQLVKVIAKEIILQDDSKEPVNSDGRYYDDEAKVPGVESKKLDEGHIIADSLGGVSNAYNITPQDSTLNRHGDQAYMEKVIRDAGGCTDFVAIITYPNTSTQIPSHYSYTYTINGNVIKDEFDNVNPDEYNANLENEKPSNNSNATSTNNNKGNSTGSTSDSKIVYWTPKGKSYHSRRNCPTLSRSKTILEGTIQESGKNDPCDKCH